ncbi:MAG: hypothetical protein OJF51_003142 [Nitrospira sp.]|nr:MAG: hypothetical protein OJF51_003142 [Nitrospira sp.]
MPLSLHQVRCIPRSAAPIHRIPALSIDKPDPERLVDGPLYPSLLNQNRRVVRALERQIASTSCEFTPKPAFNLSRNSPVPMPLHRR